MDSFRIGTKIHEWLHGAPEEKVVNSADFVELSIKKGDLKKGFYKWVAPKNVETMKMKEGYEKVSYKDKGLITYKTQTGLILMKKSDNG